MTFMKKTGYGLALLLFAGSAMGAPKVMVLGTPHFAVPGQDVINPDVGDVRTEHAQDIQAIVNVLVDWQPTKIAIERTSAGMQQEQENYRAYLDGEFELSADEIHQIAFRVAERLDHERLFGIDFRKDMDVGAVMEHAHANGQGERMQAAMERIHAYLGKRAEILRAKGLREMLVYANGPEGDRADGEYLVFASVGDEDNAVGTTQVAAWYERNLRMYANTVSVANENEDRVLVIVGDGHAPLLRQFFRQSPLLELEPLKL